MFGADAGEGGNNIVANEIRAKIAPGGQHDFMGQIMLYFSLQPSQQVKMPAHRYPFLNDTRIALKMVGRG